MDADTKLVEVMLVVSCVSGGSLCRGMWKVGVLFRSDTHKYVVCCAVLDFRMQMFACVMGLVELILLMGICIAAITPETRVRTILEDMQ